MKRQRKINWDRERPLHFESVRKGDRETERDESQDRERERKRQKEIERKWRKVRDMSIYRIVIFIGSTLLLYRTFSLSIFLSLYLRSNKEIFAVTKFCNKCYTCLKNTCNFFSQILSKSVVPSKFTYVISLFKYKVLSKLLMYDFFNQVP